MSMAWVNKTYGVNAKRGGRVVYTSDGKRESGTILSAKDGYLNVQLDGAGRTLRFHPTWELEHVTAQAGGE